MVAASDRKLRITALIGKMIDPVKIKIKTRTLKIIQAKAQGNVLEIPS
jgi:hypothetical protein